MNYQTAILLKQNGDKVITKIELHNSVIKVYKDSHVTRIEFMRGLLKGEKFKNIYSKYFQPFDTTSFLTGKDCWAIEFRTDLLNHYTLNIFDNN